VRKLAVVTSSGRRLARFLRQAAFVIKGCAATHGHCADGWHWKVRRICEQRLRLLLLRNSCSAALDLPQRAAAPNHRQYAFGSIQLWTARSRWLQVPPQIRAIQHMHALHDD